MAAQTTTRHEVLLPSCGHSGIELPLEVGSVDLHNFADFEGYSCVADELRLKWRAWKPNKFVIHSTVGKSWKNTAISVWVFERALLTERQPRDPEMPAKEDKTLAEFRVLKNDSSGCLVEFSFHGGVVFEVSAQQQYAITSGLTSLISVHPR